jgi:hypothetical protein
MGRCVGFLLEVQISDLFSSLLLKAEPVDPFVVFAALGEHGIDGCGEAEALDVP